MRARAHLCVRIAAQSQRSDEVFDSTSRHRATASKKLVRWGETDGWEGVEMASARAAVYCLLRVTLHWVCSRRFGRGSILALVSLLCWGQHSRRPLHKHAVPRANSTGRSIIIRALALYMPPRPEWQIIILYICIWYLWLKTYLSCIYIHIYI